MTTELGTAAGLVVAGAALFWVAMLGLLWRRSLVGMLMGLLTPHRVKSIPTTSFTKEEIAQLAASGGNEVWRRDRAEERILYRHL